MFKFSELNRGSLSLDRLALRLPQTPEEVLRDFYVDHGNKESFQAQYAALEIDRINWVEQEIAAGALIECGYNAEFSEWVDVVRSRIDAFSQNAWDCIDGREEVNQHWEKFQTWRRNPIVINGRIFSKKELLWLVEGHTRLAILSGLVDHGVLAKTSTHRIWFGSYD